MKPGEEGAISFAYSVSDHSAVIDFEIKRGAHQIVRDAQQFHSKRNKLICRKATMALVHGLGQSIGNACSDPHHRTLLDAEPHRDGVSGLEADPTDIAR